MAIPPVWNWIRYIQYSPNQDWRISIQLSSSGGSLREALSSTVYIGKWSYYVSKNDFTHPNRKKLTKELHIYHNINAHGKTLLDELFDFLQTVKMNGAWLEWIVRA
jgi:hypothetical protein